MWICQNLSNFTSDLKLRKNNQLARGILIISFMPLFLLKVTYGLQGYGASISDVDAEIPQKILYFFQSL